MSWFDIPKLDFSELSKPMSEEEANRLYAEVENEPEIDWRKFVADVRAGRVRLSSWDMAISFDEFARRVEAGEYD